MRYYGAAIAGVLTILLLMSIGGSVPIGTHTGANPSFDSITWNVYTFATLPTPTWQGSTGTEVKCIDCTPANPTLQGSLGLPIKCQWTGTNWDCSGGAPGTSFPIQAYHGECNLFGDGRPWPITTANVVATNPQIFITNPTGFVAGGGILCQNCGPLTSMNITAAAPTVTAVQLTADELHTVTPNTVNVPHPGVATFTTANNWVEEEGVRTNISHTSIGRINNDGTEPKTDQYFVVPPNSPPGVATYNVQTAGLTTPISVLDVNYWTPDTTDSTSICYKTVFSNASHGLTQAATQVASSCTATAAAALGVIVNGLPTKGVAVNWGAPPAGATNVAIWKCVDTAVNCALNPAEYTLYWIQPLTETGISANFSPLQTNTFIDVGGAIGPFFQPFDANHPGPIVSRHYPVNPPTTPLADDLITTITTLAGSVAILTLAPTQSNAAAVAWTDDTNALAAAMTAALNVGGSFVDIPDGCRIDYLTANNYPALYTGQTANGITLRGTRRYVTNIGANLTIDGTGNGACSIVDNGSMSGGLQLYFNVNVQDLLVSCNDRGSTNFDLGCLFSNGSAPANGKTDFRDSGDGGNGAMNGDSAQSLLINKGNCPNAVGLVISGNSNVIKRPYLVRVKQGMLLNGNNNVIEGPGDVGFLFRPENYVVENLGGVPFKMTSMTEENGPNFFRFGGTSNYGTCEVSGNYWGDSYNPNQTKVRIGDDVNATLGTQTRGFAVPNCDISKNLVQGGFNGMVLASTGSTLSLNHYSGFGTGSVNGLVIRDSPGSNPGLNTYTANTFTDIYSGSMIVDDQTGGVNDFLEQFYHATAAFSIDFTNAADYGQLWYAGQLDSSGGGPLVRGVGVDGFTDPNNTIPKFRELHRMGTGAVGSKNSAVMQQVTLGGALQANGPVCNEASGAGCVINLKNGNVQTINIADNTAFALKCTGAPQLVNEPWTLIINAAAGVTPGAITPSNCFAPVNFPAAGHPAAGTTVQCQGTVTGANQSALVCGNDIAVVATPTPAPTFTPTPTPGPTSTATPTPTPMPTP